MAKRLQLEYLWKDRPYDPAAAVADYEPVDFPSGGCRLYGQVLWPDGGYEGLRPCVILLHGYPGTSRNDDLAQALRRIGCVVLTFQHRGAWGSQGKYLLSHCVEDAVEAAAYVRSPAFCQRFHVDPDSIFLGGHSMGGNTTVQAGRGLPWLKGLILLTPYDPARYLRTGRAEQFRELLACGYVLNSDGLDAIYQDAVDHMDAFSLENAFEDLKDRNFCCVAGSLDTCAPPEEMVAPLWDRLRAHETAAIQRLVIYPAQHGLCGCRAAATEVIARFLADVLNE